MTDKPSFAQKLMRSGSIPIHFIVCRDGKNRLCHYFLMCPREKMKVLQTVRDGVVPIKNYGTVVASGFGRTPSSATLAMLREIYNFDFATLVDA